MPRGLLVCGMCREDTLGGLQGAAGGGSPTPPFARPWAGGVVVGHHTN